MKANAIPLEIKRDLEDKIVGGSDTTIDKYPYLVAIRDNGSFTCGGSILSEIKILSASHCLKLVPDISIYTVLAGTSYATDTDIVGFEGQGRRVSRVIHHSRGPNVYIGIDIAVLFLSEPLIFGKNSRALQLPLQNGSVPYGICARMAGWGLISNDDPPTFPNVLQHTTLPIVTNEECNRPSSYNGIIRDFEFCAGPMEGGRGICNGDSGSPLVVDGVQYGIVTRKNECGLPNFPGVFTRVPFYTNWVNSIQ